MAVTVAQFLQRIESSGVLSAPDLAAVQELSAEFDPGSDAEPLAKRLHREGRLTGYQVQTLWKGKGQQLAFGNYVIEDELGRGGMGVVLKARHKRMQRQVAIKVLPAAMVKDQAAIARFQREVVAAAKLTHTNIVGAFDADEINGQHILVMEFVDGRDLSSIVKKQGPLPVQQAVDCILQAARGLEFAHKQGVVHRDIKPANLLLDASGTVKILDMGLARLSGTADVGQQAELTGTGVVMGTVDYMSPEQALSTKTADHRADIYSLGISLYYLLTGRPAYEGESLMARLMAHANAPIPALAAARPEVSPGLQAVFERMVAKQAEDRYQSMTQVIADLEICRSDTSGTATLLRPKARSTNESSDNLSAFLNQLDDAGGSASAVTKTAARTGQRTQAVAEEPTMITQSEVRTERTLPPRTKGRPSNSRAQGKRTPWTDWRVLAGGGGAAVVLLLLVVVSRRSRDAEADPATLPARPAAASLLPADQGSDRPQPTAVPAVAALPADRSLTPPAAAIVPAIPVPDPVAARSDLDRLLTSPEAKWSAFHNLGPGVNSSRRELYPTLTDDELTLVFTRDNELWIAERTSLNEPFAAATRLPESINQHGPRNYQLQASLSGDGLLLAMISDRSGSEGEDVWLCERPSRQAPFSDPVRLGPPISSPATERCVVLSPDGLTLLVSGSRPGSRGADILLFTRASRAEPFGREQLLAPPVSTAGWDAASWISNDRCQLLMVNMPGGNAPQVKRLLVREAESHPWREAGEMVPPFNDSPVSSGVVTPDRRRLYAHTRHLPGGAGELDLWVAELQTPPPASTGAASPAPSPTTIAELLTSPEYVWTPPENLGPGINTTFFDEHPALEPDELTLWVSSGGELYFAWRPTPDAPFERRSLVGRVNDGSAWDSAPAISPDGLELIFQSGRGSPNGNSNLDLFIARRDNTVAGFDPPVRLPPGINTDSPENGPCFSGDGLTLLFTSARPGGSGTLDLWQATRPDRQSAFGTPVNLGSVVNSRFEERAPCLSADGTALLFDSNRDSHSNNFDLYFCTRPTPDASFGPPVSLGPVVNSSETDCAPCLSRDGRTLYFYSHRPGGLGQADVWLSRRVRKQ